MISAPIFDRLRQQSARRIEIEIEKTEDIFRLQDLIEEVAEFLYPAQCGFRGIRDS